MCTIINADCLFGIILAHVEEYEFVDLVQLSEEIQEHISDIIINISKNSVMEATSCYPSYFYFDGNSIKRVQGNKNTFNQSFLEREFSEFVPNHIIKKVSNYIDKSINP